MRQGMPGKAQGVARLARFPMAFASLSHLCSKSVALSPSLFRLVLHSCFSEPSPTFLPHPSCRPRMNNTTVEQQTLRHAPGARRTLEGLAAVTHWDQPRSSLQNRISSREKHSINHENTSSARPNSRVLFRSSAPENHW
jgi:hypothetical protein